MQAYKLTFGYDGSVFKGWQKGGLEPTVETCIEKLLSNLLDHPVKLEAASRTDAGVHAKGQVLRFETESPLSFSQLQVLCPPALIFKSLEPVASHFHPSTQAVSKQYSYLIDQGPVQCPLERKLAWHVPLSLNVAKMREAKALFLGTHDFAAFTNRCDYQGSTFRSIDEINIEELSENRLKITVTGKRFLYKMVRNIVGALVWVGKNKLTPQELAEILKNKSRKDSPMTAPAHGLYLDEVTYHETQ